MRFYTTNIRHVLIKRGDFPSNNFVKHFFKNVFLFELLLSKDTYDSLPKTIIKLLVFLFVFN